MSMMIEPFTTEQVNHIATIAAQSDIYTFDWDDRGEGPPGYYEGMALAWAQCYIKYKLGDPAMVECAKANTKDSIHDVLSWYAGIFNKAGMPNEVAGSETLRHLFVLMLGLGMRESSGEHCCGRDQSASNTSSDTCEAGLFQTSWNIRSGSDLIPPLLDVWAGACDVENEAPQGYLNIFAKGVSCSQADWKSYGSGDGKLYQDMSKSCPPFHVEVTAVGLRVLRQHWGPINNYAVEIRPEADEMFREVELYVDNTWDQPVPPEPVPVPPEAVVPTVDIVTTGNVNITINGRPV